MIRTLLLSSAEGLKENISLEGIRDFIDKDGFFIWVDLENPSEENFSLLAKVFNFHPLAIEDSKAKFNLPKIDSHKSYLFMVWHDLLGVSSEDEIKTAEVDVFLGKNFLVTTHEKKMKDVDLVFERCREVSGFMAEGVIWILHALLDEMVDEDFLLVDKISEKIDKLQDEIFEGSTQEQLKKLFFYKRQLVIIRKIVAPQREIINTLIRYELFIEKRAYIYFQDIADHLIRIIDFVDTSRDVISGAMDIYLSSVSNKLNQVMKKLTIVATIFMPLTLITGIYGMNFKNMPELYWPYGYFAILIFMVLVTVVIFINNLENHLLGRW